MKKLGFGCMRFPLLDAEDPTSIDFPQVCLMVDLFLSRGFTYFDTAYFYHGGTSEETVCRALVQRHPRDSFTLATKLPLSKLKEAAPQEQEDIFQLQLKRCGVDYFDYYLLHCIDDENDQTAQRLDSFAFVQRKKAEGYIRQAGFSFHGTPELLDEVLTSHPEVDFVQLQINYLDWENPKIQSRRCYEVAVRHGKPVVVMEPVKGGKLANPPQEVAQQLVNGDYPRNSKGETYGSMTLSDYTGYRPDLIAVGTTEGGSGYVTYEDWVDGGYLGYPGDRNKLGEAYEEWCRNMPTDYLIPVYDVEHEQVVGYFSIYNQDGYDRTQESIEEEIQMVTDMMERQGFSQQEIDEYIQQLRERYAQ